MTQRFRNLLIIGLMASSLLACSTLPKGRSLKELAPAASEGSYVVAEGDTLNVEVWGEPKLSGEVFVRDDGRFTLPLVKDVEGAGKTLEELTKVVTEEFSKFVPAASVSISVLQSAPVRYYLSGAFSKPGEYRSDRRISLLQAIASGGGFAPFADDSKIILIRKSPSGELRYRLDYSLVVGGKEPNPELKDGDIIAVE